MPRACFAAIISKPITPASPLGALGPAAGAALYDCFGAGAVIAADGALCSVSWRPHTANAGRIYFPCGTPDPSDIVGGKVDLDFSVRRELTGGDRASMRPNSTGRAGLDHGHRWPLDRRRSRWCAAARMPRPCARACRRIWRAKRSRKLSDIRIVRGPADFDPAMPRFVTAFFGTISMVDSRRGGRLAKPAITA